MNLSPEIIKMREALLERIGDKPLKEVAQIVNEILSKHTGQTIKKIEKDTDRDNFLDAKAAKTYGILDKILEERD